MQTKPEKLLYAARTTLALLLTASPSHIKQERIDAQNLCNDIVFYWGTRDETQTNSAVHHLLYFARAAIIRQLIVMPNMVTAEEQARDAMRRIDFYRDNKRPRSLGATIWRAELGIPKPESK